MKRRILALVMCVAMAFSMALPAFAEAPPASNLEQGWGLSIDGINMFGMQVQGNGSIGEFRDLQLAVPAYDLSQRWYYEMCPDGYYRMKSAISKDYALTLLQGRSAANAKVVLWQSVSEMNTALHAFAQPGNIGNNGPYRLQMHFFGMEFGATNLNVGQPVVWSNSLPYNCWYYY